MEIKRDYYLQKLIDRENNCFTDNLIIEQSKRMLNTFW